MLGKAVGDKECMISARNSRERVILQTDWWVEIPQCSAENSPDPFPFGDAQDCCLCAFTSTPEFAEVSRKATQRARAH